MSDGSGTRVECPVCGDEFDPTAAGGWCTNSECGEWQYIGDEVPEATETETPSTTADGGTATADPDEEPDDESPATDATGDEVDELDLNVPGEADEETDAEPEETDAETEETDAETEETDAETEETDDSAVADSLDVDEVDEAVCPECASAVDPDANFCPSCGTDLDESDESTLEACPSCGADVDEDDSFCASCGEDLEAARDDVSSDPAPAAGAAGGTVGTETDPDSLVLEARGEDITVSDGDTVGREARRIVTESGGDEDDAVLIHREHVRVVRDDGQFYAVDLGDNPTAVNDRSLSKGDREPIEPGDEIELSGVVTLSVDAP